MCLYYKMILKVVCMLTINFWGTSAGVPEIDKRFSCIYIQCDDTHFLLDCGEGGSHSYIEYCTDFDLIDFIFITHLHTDHAAGIFQMIQLLQLKKRKKPLYIFYPEDIEHFRVTLEMFYLMPQVLPFELIICPCADVSKYFPFVTPFTTDHLTRFTGMSLYNTCLSWGVSIKYNDKKIVYTSDIVSIHSIAKHIANTDICIIDAIHPPISEYVELEDMVTGVICLTHGMRTEIEEYIVGKVKYFVPPDGSTLTLGEEM